MISHIPMFTLLVFDIMPKLAFNSEEAILCFHIDSYWPVPTITVNLHHNLGVEHKNTSQDTVISPSIIHKVL